MMEIWTEKYRPKEFEDIAGQEDIIKRVSSFVKSKNMPHLMFSGPAGVGKTTLSLIVAKKLFGEEWNSNFLELNASDERGIDVVRNKVKDFARTKTMGNYPFKVIYLDECDSLTKEAQQALRRTMENYVNSCRFILSCNYSSKIIDPIQSRCAIFRFKPLEKKHIVKQVENIAKGEGLTINSDAYDAIYAVTEGDARRVANILQDCASMTKDISAETIYEKVAAARPQEVNKILTIAVSGDFIKSRDMLLDMMLRYGLSGLDVIKQIHKEIWNLKIEDSKKVKLLDKCGEIEFRMVEGSDEFLQLEALLANFTI
ncbi:replication factor C small subunit [Candidatus Woesearchaeota archaeon]|nr:replication factor C small subunit [Candidatus Woesearchaeota archaeon]